MSKSKTKIDDWIQAGEKQKTIRPIIQTIMQECDGDKDFMVETIRAEVLKCAKEDDFVKAAKIIDMLYAEYPHLDLKDFHFVPLDWVVGDHSSVYYISVGPGYCNGKFGAKLSSYFDEFPEYLGDPQPDSEMLGYDQAEEGF